MAKLAYVLLSRKAAAHAAEWLLAAFEPVVSIIDMPGRLETERQNAVALGKLLGKQGARQAPDSFIARLPSELVRWFGRYGRFPYLTAASRLYLNGNAFAVARAMADAAETRRGRKQLQGAALARRIARSNIDPVQEWRLKRRQAEDAAWQKHFRECGCIIGPATNGVALNIPTKRPYRKKSPKWSA